MTSFLKIFVASLIACIIALIIVAFLFTASITAFIGKMGEKDKTEIAENSVLHLNLNYKVNDRTENFPSSQFDFLQMNFDNKLGLHDILKLIDRAKRDDRIKGILLELDFEGPDFAATEELRDALEDFKSSDKFVIAYGEMIGQKMYYMASVADKIYINPSGIMEFQGLSTQLLFFKNMLDKIGVEMQVVYDGKYKSATEPIRLTQMSEENREQLTSMLNSMYYHFLNNIGASRNIAPEMLDSIASNLLVTSPEDAIKYRLVDGAKYEDEVYDEVRMLMDLPVEDDNAEEDDDDDKDEKLNLVALNKYNDADFSDLKDEPEKDFDNKIALVFAEGSIVDGKGGDDQIGSETFAKTIRKLRKDDKVKAVVLRVNSPGGSALASDVIWRELLLTKQKKPVIVSMGNVAASGGYFIAAPADMIYAQPNTITGSIGVFGVFPNMKELFNDKLGINSEVVKTGKYSDILNPFRPMTDDERDIVKDMIHRIYTDFVQIVADGRNMDTAKVHQIAQGRVYTGLEAMEIGLVDKLGGMEDAIAMAAEKADLDKYYLATYPKQLDLLERIQKALNNDLETKFLKAYFGEHYQFLRDAEEMVKGHYIKAQMPYTMMVN